MRAPSKRAIDHVANSSGLANSYAVGRLGEVVERIQGTDDGDPAYEQAVREDLVYAEWDNHEPLHSHEDIDALMELCEWVARNPLGDAEGERQEVLLFSLFSCFEVINRSNLSSEEKVRGWKRLIQLGESELAGPKPCMLSYMKSVSCAEQGDEDASISWAKEAFRTSRGHFGLLNNWSEKLAERAEAQLLANNGVLPSPDDEWELQEAAKTYRATLDSLGDDAHPIFFVTLGRLENCLGNFGEASAFFSTAQQHENYRFEHNDSKEKNVITYMEECMKISNAQSTGRTIAALSDVSRATAQLRDTLDNQVERASQIEDALNNEKVDMLEFLGFFAGIVSFIMASITVGDGLAFSERAFLVIVMLGALLVAFGALGSLLEASRVGARAGGGGLLNQRTTPIAILGLFVIILGFLLHLIG